jgi:hypothetical protein
MSQLVPIASPALPTLVAAAGVRTSPICSSAMNAPQGARS